MKLEWELSGKPLTEEEIQGFESRHKVSLPDDYREFLLATNGGMPALDVWHTKSGVNVGIHCWYSLNDDHPYDLDHSCVSTDWEKAYPLGYLQIGRDAGGSGIFISTRGADRGAVFYFDREKHLRPKPIKVAASFSEFLAELEPY